jgi:hypothetical protein
MSEPSREQWAARATRAHVAMERAFGRADGGLRRDGRWHLPWTRAHLWPFTRALVARADLLGIDPTGAPPDLTAAIERQEAALERYWDPAGPAPAYASDLPPRWHGTDRYHDDNAWVGLALVQLERLAPAGRLGRIAQLWRFAQSGWARGVQAPHPGGVFWVQQGRGTGRRNHDRNTISTAPNAQLALHLRELAAQRPGAVGAGGADAPAPQEMVDWVQTALGDDGLFFDKIRGDGTIDRATWSYNQGSMLGAHVLLARRAPRGGASAEHHRSRAEAIARRSLTWLSDRLDTQPAAFHAIWFRNLLLLADVSCDEPLREAILKTLRGYARRSWDEHRQAGDLFLPPAARGRLTLLDQSALVQILALLAWPPERWGHLA